MYRPVTMQVRPCTRRPSIQLSSATGDSGDTGPYETVHDGNRSRTWGQFGGLTL